MTENADVKPDPKIVMERNDYRLVHHPRSASWPNISDLSLERREKDAMGVERWVSVDSWCLSTTEESDLFGPNIRNTHIVALKLLLDSGPVIR